jgi:hypothetical protein
MVLRAVLVGAILCGAASLGHAQSVRDTVGRSRNPPHAARPRIPSRDGCLRRPQLAFRSGRACRRVTVSCGCR